MNELMTLLEVAETSSVGRFWVQVAILVVVAVVAGVYLYDRFRGMRHQATQDAAEDYQTALEAKEAARVAELERAQATIDLLEAAREAAIRELDKRDLAWEEKFTAFRVSVEKEIADLTRKVKRFGCLSAPTCDNVKPLEDIQP